MNHKIREIATSNLLLSPETIDDAKAIFQSLGCDPEISRYTGWNPYVTLDDTIRKINEDISSDNGSFS